MGIVDRGLGNYAEAETRSDGEADTELIDRGSDFIAEKR